MAEVKEEKNLNNEDKIKEELIRLLDDNQKLAAENKQLKEYVRKANEALNTLRGQLDESNLFNIFKRIEFGFKVLEYKGNFSKEFVDNNISVIMNLMSIPEEQPKEKASVEESK